MRSLNWLAIPCFAIALILLTAASSQLVSFMSTASSFPFARAACTVLASNPQRSPTTPSRPSSFRPRLTVYCPGIPTPTIHALPFPHAPFNLSRTAALNYFAGLPSGVSTRFWLPRTPPPSGPPTAYRIVPGGKLLLLQSALVRTLFLCAIPFTVIAGLRVAAVHARGDGWQTLLEFDGVEGVDEPEVGRRRRKKRKPRLTRAQRKELCDRFEIDAVEEPGAWTCSVCLEGVDGGAEEGCGRREPLLRLTCGHEYHKDCVYRWCKKGWSVCPLCNDDLLQYIVPETSSSPSQPVSATTSGPATEPLELV